MEIRVIIISDSGQTTPYEFKTLKEAGDFCYLKANPYKEKDVEVTEEDIIPDNLIGGEIDNLEPEEPTGFIHTLISKLK